MNMQMPLPGIRTPAEEREVFVKEALARYHASVAADEVKRRAVRGPRSIFRPLFTESEIADLARR